MEAKISAIDVPQGMHYEGMHDDGSCLIWVDILGKKFCVYDKESETFNAYDVPSYIGFVFPWGEQQFLCGLADGLAVFNVVTHKLQPLGAPETGFSGNRFNDAKLDASGRIWANTMDINAKFQSGRLYRCDIQKDLLVTYTEYDSGFVIGNGPTWSLDGKTLYHAETEKNCIYAFDFDIDYGEVANKRLFYRHEDCTMGPDGMQTDAEGNVWVAMARGARLIKLSSEGVFIDELHLPTLFPTSFVFTDNTCRSLYVTTSQLDAVIGDDLAGSILKVDLMS